MAMRWPMATGEESGGDEILAGWTNAVVDADIRGTQETKKVPVHGEKAFSRTREATP